MNNVYYKILNEIASVFDMDQWDNQADFFVNSIKNSNDIFRNPTYSIWMQLRKYTDGIDPRDYFFFRLFSTGKYEARQKLISAVEYIKFPELKPISHIKFYLKPNLEGVPESYGNRKNTYTFDDIQRLAARSENGDKVHAGTSVLRWDWHLTIDPEDILKYKNIDDTLQIDIYHTKEYEKIFPGGLFWNTFPWRGFKLYPGIEIIKRNAFDGIMDMHGRDIPEPDMLIIPEGVKKIEEQAFTGLGNYYGVKLPQSVTSIASGAFRRTYNKWWDNPFKYLEIPKKFENRIEKIFDATPSMLSGLTIKYI